MINSAHAGFVFDQLKNLLQTLSDDQYSQPLQVLSGASIGKHCRHIIEFFDAVAQGVQAPIISYDNRARNPRTETDRCYALHLLDNLRDQLSDLPHRTLVLSGDLSTDGQGAPMTLATSLHREFFYAVEHAIHHMAIIKIGVRYGLGDVLIDDQFGVAPSTLRYEHQQAH